MENHWFRAPSHSQRVSKSRKSFSWKRNRWCNTVVVSDSGYKHCGCKVQNLVMEPIKIFSCVKRLLLSKRRLGLLGINRSELMSAPWTIEMWSEFFIALQSSYSLLYSTQFSQAMCLWLAFQSSESEVSFKHCKSLKGQSRVTWSLGFSLHIADFKVNVLEELKNIAKPTTQHRHLCFGQDYYGDCGLLLVLQ